MATKDIAGLVAGIALAAAGLGAFLASSPGAAPPPVQETAAVQETAVVASQTSRAEVVAVPETAPSIPGLSPAVTRVLASGGFVIRDPGADLPPATRRVLLEHGAVLTVEELP
jgi:hypothetical protein